METTTRVLWLWEQHDVVAASLEETWGFEVHGVAPRRLAGDLPTQPVAQADQSMAQLTSLLLREQSNQRWLAAKNAKIRHFLA
jgi:hypothetical protein